MRSPVILLFSKLDKASILSRSSQDMASSPFSSFVIFSSVHSRTFRSVLCGAQNCTQYSGLGFTYAEYIGIIATFYWLDKLCLMQPRKGLAFLVAREHCWLPLSLLSIILDYYNNYIVIIIIIIIPDYSYHRLRESMEPPSLVLSENFLKVHSPPASRQFKNLLNRTGHRTEPCGRLLVIGCSFSSRTSVQYSPLLIKPQKKHAVNITIMIFIYFLRSARRDFSSY